MSRKSLEFENLPLVRVEFTFLFKEQRIPSFNELVKVRDAFTNDLPNVTDFGGPGAALNIGTELGIGLDSVDHSQGLGLRMNRLLAVWQRISPEAKYVRFERLSQLLIRGFEVVKQARDVTLVNGRYVNVVPQTDGTPSEILKGELFPAFLGENELTDSQFGFQLESGNYRVAAIRQEHQFILETQFTTEVLTTPTKTLELVHYELIRLFKEILTDHAINTWKLRS